jgi:RNA polymerase sigma-54 factor
VKASLQIRNQQTIAPALQKSLQLLQLNALEFSQEISDALDRNPLLEREDDDGRDAASDGAEILPIEAAFDDGLAATGAIDEVSLAMSQSMSDDADSASDASDAWQSTDDGMMTGDADRDFPSDAADAAFGDFANFSGDGRIRRNGVDDEGLTILDKVADQRSLRTHLMEQIGGMHLEPMDAALGGLVID